MTDKRILAFDLGASSGRAIIGLLSKKQKKLEIEEVYRFKTGITWVFDSYKWDVLKFYDEMKKSLSEISQKYDSVDSIGVDSWGVDYVLLDNRGMLVGNPYNYRDKRTVGVLEKLLNLVPKEQIFKITGIQFIQINTLVQLYSMVLSKSPQLKITKKFLMIADFFSYLFTRNLVAEYTLATTSQLYDLKAKTWSETLIKKLGLDYDLFPDIVEPGTKIGNLFPTIAKNTGLKEVPIIATASHDTAAAIAAVPAQNSDFIYVSSGTWSLVGAELDAPNTSDLALQYNFTNEGGVKNTIRFLKNIIGFWLLEECRRIWEQSGVEYSYEYLMDEALKAKPFTSLIDPNDPIFLAPPNMIEAIQQYCKKTNQKIPKDKGEIVRCILESLAFKYREVYENLKKIIRKNINKFHIFGGGARNSVLNQFSANATNLEVKAGPTESTSIGNILVQGFYSDEISSLSELRGIVRNSFKIDTYIPQDVSDWEDAYIKYQKVTKKQ